MKLQWKNGGVHLGPSNRREYHRLLWLFCEMGGGVTENGQLKDLYITTEQPTDLVVEPGYHSDTPAG